MDEENIFEMPEDTIEQIIDKISAMASSIRGDWSDPRSECRCIWALCDKLKVKLITAGTAYKRYYGS